MVYVYVGNIVTGDILRKKTNTNDEEITKTINGFSEKLGGENVVWAIYNTAQDIGLRDLQFNNFLASHMECQHGDEEYAAKAVGF